MRYLNPLILRDSYHAPIEKEINRIMLRLMYQKMVNILGITTRQLPPDKVEIQNSLSFNTLLNAIARGSVYYERGAFRGVFNSGISRALVSIGAQFDKDTQSFRIPQDLIPTQISFANAEAQARYDNMRGQILTTLANVDVDQVDLISQSEHRYSATIDKMEADLQRTLGAGVIVTPRPDNPAVSGLAAITIEARLSDTQRDNIAYDWGENLDLYIKGWAEESILKLRKEIEPRILAGGRAEGLKNIIAQSYGVSLRKAKFLAMQETSLLMSNFQKQRYLDIGLENYKWSTSHDSRVRHDHRELNGKIFSWKSPPITNHKTGARNHPGQDYGCRCNAVPAVP